jgi:hypothetical protein
MRGAEFSAATAVAFASSTILFRDFWTFGKKTKFTITKEIAGIATSTTASGMNGFDFLTGA